MTRKLLELISDFLYKLYQFLFYFWDKWGTWLSVIPIVKDIFTQLTLLLDYVDLEFFRILYWWDHLREDATFLSDLYNFFFFLRVGFEDYVLLEGDPENIARLVYYPAAFVYRLLILLENTTYTLDTWYRLVIKAIKDALTWDIVKSSILTWLPKLEDAVTWFINSVKNVLSTVDTWWDTTKTTVQDWIAIALKTAKDLIAAVATSLATLQTAWDNFKDKIPSLEEVSLWWGSWWANILTPLTKWWDERLKEVNTLIDSTLKTWFPFYDDLVKLWAGIKLFFTDPEDWLYKAADRIIERFW